jgi:hypothetical protein
MGGTGSGRWGGHRKARTVESCACVQIGAGRKVSATTSGGISQIDQEKQGDESYLVLRGRRNGRQAGIWIQIQFWKPRFGGRSLFLLCPGCGRKCRTLYTPPEVAEYRCRLCRKLVYESSQTAHLWDRGFAAALLAPMCEAKGIRMREVGKVIRREAKERRAAQERR